MGGSLWGTTPQLSIEAACRDRGLAAMVAACITLIDGDDVDPAIVAALAGPDAPRFLDAPADQRYWLRVWGARGLLWALALPGADSSQAVRPLVAALGDEHWRVREMAAKVVARYRLDAAQPAIANLLQDPVPRVRSAAARAQRMLSTGL
jgi:HEAT repeat protein